MVVTNLNNQRVDSYFFLRPQKPEEHRNKMTNLEDRDSFNVSEQDWDERLMLLGIEHFVMLKRMVISWALMIEGLVLVEVVLLLVLYLLGSDS